MMVLEFEDQILNQEFRANCIKDFESQENIERKKESKCRYDVYYDKIKEKVLEQLKREQPKGLNPAVENRVANINFCRKIVEKKALVYRDGVVRETEESNQPLLDAIVDELNINSVMKEVNKYVELDNNVAVAVMPFLDEVSQKYYVRVLIYPAYMFDAIVDAKDLSKARVYVTSYFDPKIMKYAEPNEAGIHGNKTTHEGISYEDTKAYVWWSRKYHFTTDNKGQILTGSGYGDGVNPIGVLNFLTFSRNEGMGYWKEGGDDLVNYTILINTLLTDLYYIAKFQGMGIFYLFGKGVPKSIDVGPSTVITVDVEEGEPTPQIGFASANPPLQDHISMIQTSLNYLLLSNNLEPGVMDGMTAKTAESGVQEIIKRSENTTDIEEQREVYRDNEPELFSIILKIMELYRSKARLTEAFDEYATIDPGMEITIKFPPPQPYMSEKEKVEVLKARKELGIDTLEDTLKRDNPDLSVDEVKDKLAKLNGERDQLMMSATGSTMIKEVEDDKEEQDSKA